MELPERAKPIPVKTSDEIYKSVTEALQRRLPRAASRRPWTGSTSEATGGGAPDPSGIEAGAFSGQSVVNEMQDDKATGNWDLP